MDFKYFLFAIVFGLCRGEKDDKKWVWNENNRNPNGRSYVNNGISKAPNSRYNVYEEVNDYSPMQFYPSQQPLLPLNQRPTAIYENRPSTPNSGFLLGGRPGGVYHQNLNRPTYGSQQPYYPPEGNPDILAGPVPSWSKNGPNKIFDKCKCTEKFNCNSPGISYGQCDIGKQYCCYSTKRDLGGPISTKPQHSIENGILVGPGGPVDPINQLNNYPGGFQGPHGRPGKFTETNEYSPANGVLVGPGGPYDRPFGVGRSAKISAPTRKI